jgi:periplasmic glucans biosynthesis protein
MKRRGLLKSAVAIAALSAPPLRALATATPDDLIARARAMAAVPYQPSPRSLVAPYDSLTYDSYRGLQPTPGLAAQLPLGNDYHASLLAPGWLFRDPVQVALPKADFQSFDPTKFTHDPRYYPFGVPEGDFSAMGYSGLRLTAPLNGPQLDEVLVLQGASYFRALARNTVYGLSARGLALGTGGPAPEEFPVTRQIVVFGTESDGVRLGCLIDSPRATAALLMTVQKGTAAAPATHMDCLLHLFPRETLHDAGIAPLTSMFQHNDLGPARIDDFRPAVHDSDVLIMRNGAGESLWRPLSNPATVQMSAFVDTAPRAFGLVQTPTEFERFRDAEGAYHRRPSAIVTPSRDWGAGAVMLLEIPTIDEYSDNIVAFWRPAEPLVAGGRYSFGYRLSWTPPGLGPISDETADFPLTPLRAASGVEPLERAGRLYVLDFKRRATAPEPEHIGLDIAPVEGGTVTGQTVYTLDAQTLRTSFILTPDDGMDALELRVRLRVLETDNVLAPVWMHRWTRTANGSV